MLIFIVQKNLTKSLNCKDNQIISTALNILLLNHIKIGYMHVYVRKIIFT